VLIIVFVKHCPVIIFWTKNSAAVDAWAFSGADSKIIAFWQSIADVTQKPLVLAQIKWLAGALTMILIV
jgi:hypothetical protein